jgi:hypothetical protein
VQLAEHQAVQVLVAAGVIERSRSDAGAQHLRLNLRMLLIIITLPN